MATNEELGIQFTELADNQVEATLATGEKYKGTWRQIAEEGLKSKVHTRKYADEKSVKADETARLLEQETAEKERLRLENEQLRKSVPVYQTPEETLKTAKYVAEMAVQGMDVGMPLQELTQELKELIEYKKKMQMNDSITAFWNTIPEYPGTEQANTVIGQILDERNWQMTPENLRAAHLEAIWQHSQDERKGYAPTPKQQVDASRLENRPGPPPMLRTGNPEVSQGASNDPWSMPMADLRNAAIRQQLEPRK